MTWARWTRSDQAGLETLLYVVVGLGALSVVPRVVAAVRGEPISITTELPQAAVRPAAGIDAPVTGSVVLDDPSAGQQVLALLPRSSRSSSWRSVPPSSSAWSGRCGQVTPSRRAARVA